MFDKVVRTVRINRYVDDVLDAVTDTCNQNDIVINGSREMTVTELLCSLFERNILSKTKDEKIKNLSKVFLLLELKNYETGEPLDQEQTLALATEVLNRDGVR